MGRGARLVTLAASAAISLLSVLGCKQTPLCPALSACGGERDPATGDVLRPLGDWVLAPGHPSCSEDLYLPPNDPRLYPAELTVARMPPPEQAAYDWCLLLVTGPGPGSTIQVRQPRFFVESPAVGVARISYQNDGTFSAFLAPSGTFSLDFPAYCVRAFGAVDDQPLDPADPTSPKVHVCERLQVAVAAAGAGEGPATNVDCIPNPRDPPGQEGCICTFDLNNYGGGPTGTFRLLDDHTILHTSLSNFPQTATFCAQGDRLQLTGADGAYLFDVRGLRTLDLVRASPPAP